MSVSRNKDFHLAANYWVLSISVKKIPKYRSVKICIQLRELMFYSFPMFFLYFLFLLFFFELITKHKKPKN